MKLSLLLLSLLTLSWGFTQSVVWQDGFENAANWQLNQSSGLNGLDANVWVLSDAEGGVAPGGCGTANNGDKTLHVSCQGAWCVGTGATYNAGDGGLGFIDAVTNKRALFASNINTMNTQNVSLEFDYIGMGQPGFDFGTVLYSTDAGVTWNTLQPIAPGQTCASGQGLWAHASIPLPAQCMNITTLRIGFQWQNDNDGAGSDPSLAINNVKITAPNQPSVAASFDLSSSTPCLGDCISITNTSVGANTYAWDFGNGQTSNLQQPGPSCYSFTGTYTVQLIACQINTCDTSILTLTVQPLLTGTVNVTSQGPYTWPLNGLVYTTSGTYVDTASNINACDSLVTLVLTVNATSLEELNPALTSLLKITDVAGREVEQTKGQVLLLYYADGTIKRIYINE